MVVRNEADRLAIEILKLYGESETEAWDLHSFFELLAGDDQNRRLAVFESVDELVESGHLESRGSDFYTITGKGRNVAARAGENE